MPRKQHVQETVSTMFIDRRSHPRRRTSDLETNGHDQVSEVIALPRVCRWVQRDRKTVRFSQGTGPFQGRIHIHHLPTLAIAFAFAVALLKTDEDGYPAPLDPEQWAAWQEESDKA